MNMPVTSPLLRQEGDRGVMIIFNPLVQKNLFDGNKFLDIVRVNCY